MNFEVLKPVLPATGQPKEYRLPPAFKLPEAKEEELKVYVKSIKAESPKEYLTIGPISFEKYNFHPDDSLPHNSGKPPRFMQSTVLLSEEQAAYIQDRAYTLREKIRCRNEKDEPVSMDICYGDLIVLCPLEDYGQDRAVKLKAYAQKILEQFTPREMTKDSLEAEMLGIKDVSAHGV